jgi:hypothetical protein
MTFAAFLRSKASSRGLTEADPDSGQIFVLRRYLIGFLVVLAYILLDRSTVFLQMWSGISAWYPPTGLALALLICAGPRFAPAFVAASLISAIFNYHQSISVMASYWEIPWMWSFTPAYRWRFAVRGSTGV